MVFHLDPSVYLTVHCTVRYVAMEPCKLCNLPLPPKRLFVFGRSAVHTYHGGVCKALQKLCNASLAEKPLSSIGRMLDSVSPRTATSVRHTIVMQTLRHASALPTETLAFVVTHIGSAGSEQKLLSSLTEEAGNQCMPALQSRLYNAGITIQKGSIVVRSPRSEMHLSQAIERITPDHESPRSPRAWTFGTVDVPCKKPTVLRHSVRITSERTTPLQLSKVYWNMCLLEELDVSGMKMMEFPPAITLHMLNLTSIYAQKCHLERLPNDIDKLVHLADLDVSDNVLTDLPDELGNLLELRVLVITRNEIALMPRLPPLLQVLLAGGNVFSAMPWAELAGLKHLRQLDVSGNLLDTVSNDLAHSKSLRYVDLQHNIRRLSVSGEIRRNRIVLC